MIFGFNTDVKFENTVYHVQSEARQLELRLETQVFLRGRCLGKHATSYAERMKEPDFSEEHMHQMLKDQHKHFVTAVREGRIEAEFAEHPQREAPEPVPLMHLGEVGATAGASEAAAPATFAVEPVPSPHSGHSTPAPIIEPEPLHPAPAPPVEILPQPAAAKPAPAVPVDSGLRLAAAGKVIGKGLSLECLPPAATADGSDIVISVLVSDENGPAAGAQVTCRISSGKAAAMYVYATSGAQGVADMNLARRGLDLSATALLVQASHRGKSASRKYKLQSSL